MKNCTMNVMAYEVTEVYVTQQPDMVFFGKLNFGVFLFVWFWVFFLEKYIKKAKDIGKEINVYFYLLLLSVQCNL